MRTTGLTRVDLPPATDAAATARAEVRAALPDQDEEVVATACLLADELVANAVTHAGAPFQLVLDRAPRRLTVEVVDWSTEAPEVLDVEPDAVAGRGLHLLDGLADEWGISLHSPGKSVWFTVALR
jgi:anti-sigma regulatory factor (Ser/Thr protein kinase)